MKAIAVFPGNKGFSPLIFDAMQSLAKNGTLVLLGVTGGDRRAEVPADKNNLEGAIKVFCEVAPL
jgi:threonine dehydrogenase-like Zn-dependent dehydrogenase